MIREVENFHAPFEAEGEEDKEEINRVLIEGEDEVVAFAEDFKAMKVFETRIALTIESVVMITIANLTNSQKAVLTGVAVMLRLRTSDNVPL